jgi:hypothetical protein
MRSVAAAVPIDRRIINAMKNGGPAARLLVLGRAIEQPRQDHGDHCHHDDNAQNGAKQIIGGHFEKFLLGKTPEGRSLGVPQQRVIATCTEGWGTKSVVINIVDHVLNFGIRLFDLLTGPDRLFVHPDEGDDQNRQTQANARHDFKKCTHIDFSRVEYS